MTVTFSVMSANIASRLTAFARQDPSRLALVCPRGRRMTFQQLEEETDRYAHGLTALGITRGMRVLMLVPPGAEFFALMCALLKMGAVAILIDPGMGKTNLLHCIQDVEPQALIAVPVVHLLRMLSRSSFRHVRYSVTVGRRWWWDGPTHAQIRRTKREPFPAALTDREELAAIVFTTGSTGIPKGVQYLHATLDAQADSIHRAFHLTPDQVVLAAYPPFALFCLALGATCVLPAMNPAKPAEVNPGPVVELIRRYQVTMSLGSPAFWDPVSRYCLARQIRLPSLKTILMFGAPVAEPILQRLSEILPAGADAFTPYGATEALPLTSISGSEILRETGALTRRGAGACVGQALSGITLKILRISDEPIPTWDEALVLPPGQIGEIVVKGPVVTAAYDHREPETALAKIHEGATVWHRMGDVGYLDERQRLWFCGRKAHRVAAGDKTLFTVRCEAVFNQHPDVARSALVGVGPRSAQQPLIVIEPAPGKMPKSRQAAARFRQELLELGSRNDLTRDIAQVLFHPHLPVDFRHNAKILREQLAVWAARGS